MWKTLVIGAVLAIAVPVMAGCATKDWVKRMTEARVGPQEQRLTSLEHQSVVMAETAGEARGRADSAMARAETVDKRLTRLWTSRHQRDLVETVNVHFGFDQADLDDRALTALAGLVKELKVNPRLGVELQGYADPRGAVPYNVQLSHRRVESVRRYLVQQGVALPRIHSIGLGPIVDSKESYASQRRVTLRVMVEAD